MFAGIEKMPAIQIIDAQNSKLKQIRPEILEIASLTKIDVNRNNGKWSSKKKVFRKQELLESWEFLYCV